MTGNIYSVFIFRILSDSVLTSCQSQLNYSEWSIKIYIYLCTIFHGLGQSMSGQRWLLIKTFFRSIFVESSSHRSINVFVLTVYWGKRSWTTCATYLFWNPFLISSFRPFYFSFAVFFEKPTNGNCFLTGRKFFRWPLRVYVCVIDIRPLCNQWNRNRCKKKEKKKKTWTKGFSDFSFAGFGFASAWMKYFQEIIEQIVSRQHHRMLFISSVKMDFDDKWTSINY